MSYGSATVNFLTHAYQFTRVIIVYRGPLSMQIYGIEAQRSMHTERDTT